MAMDIIGAIPSPRLPDQDAIKMFVGQVPRSMQEADLRKMFEEFGEIYQINVLRDKRTGVSKGCCFITFFTRKAALDAQNLLHNIKTLPGMYHPIQMKPADTDNKIGRKLFLGMLSKSCTEQDIREMFSQFGEIEQCTILRDSENRSKGCAFVTYATKQMALAAIRRLNQSIIMQGCSMPLLVQFADTPRVKDEKKMYQETQELLSAASSNPLAALTPHYLSQLLQSPLHHPHHPSPPTSLSGANGAASGGSRHPYGSSSQGSGLGLQGVSGVQQLLQTSISPQQHVYDSSGGGGAMVAGNGAAGGAEATLQTLLAGLTGQSSGLTVNMQNLAALAAIASVNQSGLQALSQPGYTSSLPALGAPGGGGSAPQGKQVEGPPGANLFIYHLPQDFTDADLAQTFWPYGKVISAKVFIDKQTNLSKCFGFVSYDSAEDAQTAIQAMNGQTVANKRLKVQLKRPKEARPY